MEEPLISVCVISYNQAAFIRQALESVAIQKVSFPIEMIIADDCSTDGTVEIIENFIKNHTGKVIFLKREKNIGAADNFVELIETARGKYVAYLEGDDYWTHPLKLQMQVDFLEKNEAVVISSHNTVIEKDTGEAFRFNRIRQYIDGPHDAIYTIKNYITKVFFHSSSIVYRRSSLPPFPEWYKTAFGGDFFLVLLLGMKGDIHFINELLSVYRIHETSISGFSSRYEIYRNFEAHLKKFDKYSGYIYHKALEDKRFSYKYGIYYYYPGYFRKLWFSITNLGKIIRLDQSVVTKRGRYKIFLPTSFVRSKTNLFTRNQREKIN